MKLSQVNSLPASSAESADLGLIWATFLASANRPDFTCFSALVHQVVRSASVKPSPSSVKKALPF